jgi:hypothetical protein
VLLVADDQFVILKTQAKIKVVGRGRYMKLLITLNAGLFVMAAALFAVFFAPSAPSLHAQGPLEGVVQDEEEVTEEEEAESPVNESENGEAANEEFVSYQYVAQPGDSYTLMARKATQTYGLKFDVSLSAAQIIFVETNLTQAADSPLLDVHQEVEINEADVADWVEEAQQLSETEEAAWGAYVPTVDFSTDNVGE